MTYTFFVLCVMQLLLCELMASLPCCSLQVVVDPPSVEQATSILRGLRPRYERHHGITISEAALLAAAQLSARYISGRHLPDKAIDCLDEAAAQVRVGPQVGWGGAVSCHLVSE
jgi:hypothetical protein